MIKVLPIQSKAEQEEICKKCGVKYNPNLLAYKATVDDELVGISQFTMDKIGGHIIDLACVEGVYNTQVLFLLGRATMNFIDLTGVHEAYYEAADDNEDLIKTIGFNKNDDEKYYVDMTDFFISPCEHDKN